MGRQEKDDEVILPIDKAVSDDTMPIVTMRHGYHTVIQPPNHLFVCENTKKLLAFGIGGVWFGIFSSEIRRGRAVTNFPSSSV